MNAQPFRWRGERRRPLGPVTTARVALGVGCTLLLLQPAASRAADLAVTSPASGDLLVLQRDPGTGALLEAEQRAGRWRGWAAVGGDAIPAGSGLAAVAMPTGTVHAFYRGADGRMHRRSRTGGVWSAPSRVSERLVDAGPAATRRGGTIELVAREASTGRIARWTWQPGRPRAKRTSTGYAAGAGVHPTIAWSGRTLDLAYVPPAPPERRRVAVQILGGTHGAAVPYAGLVAGSPALASDGNGRSWVVVRQPSGGLARRERSASGATVGPWRALQPPPAPVAAAASPAVVVARPAPGRARVLTTALRGEDPATLLLHRQATGWQRVTLSPPPRTPSSAFGDAVVGSGVGAAPTPTPSTAPAGPVLPNPTSSPAPSPTPLPTPTPVPPPQPSLDGPEPLPAGTIRYFGRTNPENNWDAWFRPVNTPASHRAHLLRNTWRLELFANGDPVNNGGFATSWYPGGMVYRQLYTVDPDTAQTHPSWVMRDAAGNPLYADDGGDETGVRRLLAGNILNPAYRAWAIDHAPRGGTDGGGLLQTLRAGAFRGLWLDNVNPELLGSGLVTADGTWVGEAVDAPVYAPASDPARPADGSVPPGACPGPASTTQGVVVTDTCWAAHIATFLDELRAAMPADAELLSNVPWYRTQRDVPSYEFVTDPTPNFVLQPTVPPTPPAPAGGLWTAHGQAIAEHSTYVNVEGSFWANARGSGPGRGGPPGTGRSVDGYSLDMLFRYLDALHRRGKGFVADNWMDRTRLNVAAEGPDDDPLLRVQEFNLAGYLLATDGRDGIGDYNPTDALWPATTGSGGPALYGIDAGVAAERPTNLADVGTNADDPGPGPTGRGVATIGPQGHRLWGRRFVREDGDEVYVLLAEPAATGTPRTGDTLTYRLPDPAMQCTNMTRAVQAPYARWDAAAREARLAPASSLLLRCRRPG